MAETRLKAKLREDDRITLQITVEGKIVDFEIYRGDCGIGIDVIGAKGTITELGWASDDDMDLIEDED